jgi:hypothetical protein
VTFSYENNAEDWTALTEHQMANDPAIQRRRRFNIYIRPVLLFVCFFMFGLLSGRSIGQTAGLIAGSLGGLTTFIYNRWWYRNLARKLVEKALRDPAHNSLLARRTVSLSEDGILEETSDSRHLTKWSGISVVVFHPDRLFVCTSPVAAHVFPRRALGDEQFRQIAEEIRKYRPA